MCCAASGWPGIVSGVTGDGTLQRREMPAISARRPPVSFTVDPPERQHRVIAKIARETNLTYGEVTLGLAGMGLASDPVLKRMVNELSPEQSHAVEVLRCNVLA
jgi:hypothetical protein